MGGLETRLLTLGMNCALLCVLCFLYGELLLGLHESPAHLLLQLTHSLLHDLLCHGGGTAGREGGWRVWKRVERSVCVHFVVCDISQRLCGCDLLQLENMLIEILYFSVCIKHLDFRQTSHVISCQDIVEYFDTHKEPST